MTDTQQAPLTSRVDASGVDMSASTFTAAARDQATAKKQQIEHLREKQQELQRQIEQEQRILDALTELLRSLGCDDVGDLDDSPQTVVQSESTGTGFAVPGNRSEDMPLRRTQYQEISIGDAVEGLLRNTRQPMHSNDLARAIFHIKGQEDLTRVRGTMNSTLAIGVKRGRWIKTDPATYAIE